MNRNVFVGSGMTRLASILSLAVLVSCILSGSGNSREITSGQLDNLHRYVGEKARNNEFSGVVLIARNGEILFHEAYGMASRRYRVPNGKDTRFNIGSINKLFTSVAIAKLLEIH